MSSWQKCSTTDQPLFQDLLKLTFTRANGEQGILSSATSKLVAPLPSVYPLDVICQISSVRSGPEVVENDVSINVEQMNSSLCG